jgi:hypothetical protein
MSMQLGTIWSNSLYICFWQHRCTRIVFWLVLFYPNNTVKNLIFKQSFPGLVPLLQWRLLGLLMLQRLLYLLHLLLTGRLPALLLLLLEMLLFRLLLILMLQLLLRRSLPGLLMLLSTLLLLERLLCRLLIILKLSCCLGGVCLASSSGCYRRSWCVVLLIYCYCCWAFSCDTELQYLHLMLYPCYLLRLQGLDVSSWVV